MRSLVAVLLTAVILLPIQASAASGTLWDQARVFEERGTSGGTIGGLTLDIKNNSPDQSEALSLMQMPTIVEVYTATWCANCVETEQALDEAIETVELNWGVTRIHYHRFLYETLDPFGSNSTDSRWVETYGIGSLQSTDRSYVSSDGRNIQIIGTERSAPSKVFHGEMMYTGTSTKSNSLLTDYSAALALGSKHPFEDNGSMSLQLSQDINYPELFNFNWETDLWSEDENWEVNIWLMFVEKTAYFPEGSNGKENYSHVLHEAVNIGSQTASSIQLDPPEPWDGDDMSIIMLVDWKTQSIQSGRNTLPAPALSTLLFMLAALVPRRDSDYETLQ